MKSVVITGANGQLGGALRKVLDGIEGVKTYFTDVDTLDICDMQQVENFFHSHQIGTVVNCAAYTAVDRAEEDVDACMRINCDAVRTIGTLAAARHIKVIHLSTDYVFDGRNNRPYRETDETCPVSTYGMSKRAGEQALLSICNESVIIRTAWLYSENGSNFVKTMLRLGSERDTLRVVADQRGTPTYAGDLADVIKSILQADRFIPGIYHYTNEGDCTWYDFALKIMELADMRCQVYPQTTAEYPAPATRPAYSVLDKSKIKETYAIQIPAWEESLRICLGNMGQNDRIFT
jgi:dTDP-4-dehydrorhamnose reductase